MHGNFSPESIEAFTRAVGEENFSEGLFDFTRCIRPDGSAYGSRGKCRKGTEGGPLVKDKNTAREMRKGLAERVKSARKTSEKGSLAPDRNAWKNREELDKYTKDWQQRNGLDNVSQKHDRFHSAVHSFLGRSSEDFARVSGIKGITPMEEILVNHVNQHITESDPGERISSRKNLLDAARSMKESFIDSGEIKRGSKEDRNWDRSAHQAARIFEVMSKKPDFDEFVSQLQKFPNPYDE